MGIDVTKIITPEAKAAKALADKRAGMVASKAQAKIALKRAGLFGQINQMMKSLPDDDETKISWSDAQSFTRESPTMLAVAAQFNLTDTQLDALFEDAKSVKI